MNDTQLRLFETENPLKAYFDREFFKQIPTEPGIYWMKDKNGKVIYVGKAKNLKNRLRSYLNTTIPRLPIKTQKLLRAIQEIDWETAPDEATALLRENHWIRSLKPRFNSMNVRPETYLYIGYSIESESAQVGLFFSEQEIPTSMKTFGAYRGIGRVRKAHAALLRWLWALLNDQCNWPHCLAKPVAPRIFKFEILYAQKHFLTVIDSAVENWLTGFGLLPELVLPQDEPAPILQTLWRNDQLALNDFFQVSARHYRSLRERFSIQNPVIPQNAIDDLKTISTLQNSKLDTAQSQAIQDRLSNLFIVSKNFFDLI